MHREVSRPRFQPGGLRIAGSLLLGLLASLVWCTFAPARACADTRRIAILVGNNQGAEGQPPLHFAEADASKMARLLVELGHVESQDVLLLQGQSPAELSSAIRLAGERVKSWHDAPDVRALLLFYFSGHSDGKALDLGSQQVTFEQLKSWIASVDADVRLLVIDSCKSGSLLQSKGGARVSPFEVSMNDELPNLGEALITSSAANESALESDEIRGSFFTHYFVSGLRGAADTSGDGQVSLAEAYKYAFVHTASATAATFGGVQHPSYDYRLSGQGELILTSLSATSATLTLPTVFERVLISNLLRDEIAVELNPRAASKVALRPGRYGIRAWKNGRQLVAGVRLADGAQTTLRAEDFAEVHNAVAVSAKGRLLDLTDHQSRWNAFVALGLTNGVAQNLGGITAARIGVRSAEARGFTLNLDSAAGETTTFSEYRATVQLGYGIGAARGQFSGFASASLGGGIVGQRSTPGHTAATPTGVVSPAVSGDWWVTRHLAVGVEGDLALAFYERDSRLVASLWPVIYGGIVFAP